MKPFIKWAGGKTQLLDKILPLVPDNIDTYVEPFVGGGGVLSKILDNPQIKMVYINDLNTSLVITYTAIKNDVTALMQKLDELTAEFNSYGTDEERKEMYYRVRDGFNNIRNSDALIDIAALFIFINKTCFNGLYRENKRGRFDTPFNGTKHITLYDRQNLLDWHTALQKCIIYNESYERVNPDIDYSKSFWYLDPPYKNTFTGYNSSGFSDADQEQLKNYVDILTDRGAKVLESNSDCEYFDRLYEL